MENNRTNKIKVELNDILYLQNKLKSSARDLVDTNLSNETSSLKHQRNLVQQEMNEWIDNIFMALSNNVEFTDVQGVDGPAFLGLSDPIDERLKAKVTAKEAELTAIINKTVETRATQPTILSNLANDLYKSQSQYAEDLIITPSNEIQVEEDDIPIDDIKRDYTEAMHTLSQLKQDIPTQISKIDNLEQVLQLTKQ